MVYLPFGNIKDVKAAFDALQAAGPGMKQSNEFYQELLRLGVVNSNVRIKTSTRSFTRCKLWRYLK